MKHAIVPTNPDEEKAKGRIALWLDPADVEWLASHCCCPPNASEEVKERCARVRFRASAALHKAGLRKNVSNEDNREI